MDLKKWAKRFIVIFVIIAIVDLSVSFMDNPTLNTAYEIVRYFLYAVFLISVVGTIVTKILLKKQHSS